MSDAPKWFTDAVAAPSTVAELEVRGAMVRYRSWGNRDNPGVLLVHGGAAHAHWWSFLAPLLTDRYFVVAIDLTGHGESDWRDEYPRRLWADEVVAVIEHARFSAPPVVIGHSMGGMVTIIAASVHGDRLAGAIAVDAPVRRPDPESDQGSKGTSFANPKTYPDKATAIKHFRLVPSQPCDNEFILHYIAEHSVRKVDSGYTWKFDRRVFHNRSKDVMSDYLANVHCRIALVVGQKSIVVPPETGEYMYELLGRNAPLIEIPEAHHHLVLDQPLAFISVVRALLADWEHSVPQRRPSIPPRAGD